MSLCTRNCWIFAALMGLVVWAFSMAGGVGVFAGLFLGFVTAWLLGGLLVMLFCEGQPDDDGAALLKGAVDDATVATVPQPQPQPQPQPLPDAPPIAEAPRPASMPGAPEGAGHAEAAVTFSDDAEAGRSRPLGFTGDAVTAVQAEPAATGKKAKKSKDDKKSAKTKAEKPDKAAKKSKDKAAKRVAGKTSPAAPQPDETPLPVMTVTTPAAAASLKAAHAGRDELGRIDGIGPKLTEWLHANGITRFAQIAAWTPEEAARWAARLGRWGGRIESDDWIGQARILAAGGETAHSRRVDRGEST